MDCEQAAAYKHRWSLRYNIIVPGWRWITWHIYVYVYCRYFYRIHMRWLHKRGRHWWKGYDLIDGPKFDKCDWCGAHRLVRDND